MEKLVIIPTYNEKDNIRNIIDAVLSLKEDFHILIVDDGSPDGTGNIVKELQQQHPGELFLEERSGKQGLGTAYIHGFKAISISLKWMLISLITQKICLVYTMPVQLKVPMLR